MNDIPQCVKDSKLANYADDTRVGNNVKTTDDIRECLLPDLLKICNWLKANKLCLNIMKTEFMLIGTSPKIMKQDNLVAFGVDGELIKRA